MYSMTSRCLYMPFRLQAGGVTAPSVKVSWWLGWPGNRVHPRFWRRFFFFFLARQNPPTSRALSKVYPFRRLLSKTGSSPSVALTLDIVLEGTEQCTGAARNDLTGMSEKQLDIKGEKEGWTSKAALWKTIVVTELTRHTRDNVSVNINSGNSKTALLPVTSRHAKKGK